LESSANQWRHEWWHFLLITLFLILLSRI
jgi:hypothetical protein